MSASTPRLRSLTNPPLPSWLPGDAAILQRLSARDPWLRRRRPYYQLRMIKDLAALVPPGPCHILDVGAGSGVVGETIAELFPGKSVVGVDVAHNPLPGLRIPLLQFDGTRLPFADASFDCVLFCNVLHHVQPPARGALLREALRVSSGGPILIKDHLAVEPLDRLRLWMLDALGNAARGFMVSAEYLSAPQWEELLRELDCAAEVLPASPYRRGLWAWCFPNRLEISLRISRAAIPGR
jgi:SAM-dependent methyltransferase